MIDPHVHLRDWNQADKETVKHGLEVAYDSGLDGVFEMPNTAPPMLNRDDILRRIELADLANVDIFHGIYVGLTTDPFQLEEAVHAHAELFPRVVGFKLFAGKSTGNLSVPVFNQQRAIFHRLTNLDYRGVVAVHCEKESEFKPELWNSAYPLSHSLVRPPAAEIESIRDLLSILRETQFKGTLHIAHISTDGGVELIKSFRQEYPGYKISCGITPHHLFLNTEAILPEKAMLYKVNPPIRPKIIQEKMLDYLKNGDINWIETDHAPHTLRDKSENFASGMPGLPIYFSLKEKLFDLGLNAENINRLTHENVNNIFHLTIPQINIPNINHQSDYPYWLF